MKNYSKAENYYMQSLNISESINTPVLETMRSNLNNLHKAMGKHWNLGFLTNLFKP